MEHDLDEFSEFKHVTSVPKVGTTAYDIWLRGADRRRDEEHERAGSRMLQRAFNAVRHAWRPEPMTWPKGPCSALATHALEPHRVHRSHSMRSWLTWRRSWASTFLRSI